MAATTPVEQQSFARRTLSVRRAARFAYAAGAAGMLGRLLLLALYALLAAGSADQYSVGAANDLVGTLESACMIPVALALAGRLPDRRAARVVQVAGLSAMAANAIAAPLMVVGVLSCSVATLIAAVAIQVLAAWLFLVNRWLRRSPDWWLPVARLGQLLVGRCCAVLRSSRSGCCCRGARGHSCWCLASARSPGSSPTWRSQSGS